MADDMTPNRPYLLRALYEWIGDNDMTPHILVDAGFPGVDVPEQAFDSEWPGQGGVSFTVRAEGSQDGSL